MKTNKFNNRVFHFFVFSMKKFLIIPFVMLFFVSLTCPVVAFDKEDLEKLKSTKKCPKCDLERANLSGIELIGANLSYANLSGADLSGASLTWVDLSFADLILAIMSKAKLYRTNLRDANLFRANLSKANMSKSNLSGAVLCHTLIPDGKEDNSGCK